MWVTLHNVFHTVIQKTPTFFIWLWFLQMLTDFYIWHTVYWVNMQHDRYLFTHLSYVLLLHFLVKHLCQKLPVIWNIYSDNNKSQASVATHLRCAGYALLQNYRSVCWWFFLNRYTCGEVTGKIIGCFTCPVCRALSRLKSHISPDTMQLAFGDKSCH